MLFIFAVLASNVAFVAAQGESSPLPADAKKVWNESLERYAEKWINTPNIVQVDAVIKEKQCFKKLDRRSWFDKVLKAFGNQIKENKKDIELLDAPIPLSMGCNGVLNAQLVKYDCVTIVCLYREQK